MDNNKYMKLTKTFKEFEIKRANVERKRLAKNISTIYKDWIVPLLKAKGNKLKQNG